MQAIFGKFGEGERMVRGLLNLFFILHNINYTDYSRKAGTIKVASFSGYLEPFLFTR